MLFSLLQGCITQPQLERESRMGTPPARDFPGAAAPVFPISLGAVRLEKMREAASFSLSLAPGWHARGSQELPKWAEQLWEHIFQVQEEMEAHPTWILPTHPHV